MNSQSCKILFDIYYTQRNDGNLINRMKDAWNETACVQIVDHLGRQEPTTDEINYKNIFKFMYSKNCKDLPGMEHGISTPGTKSGSD